MIDFISDRFIRWRILSGRMSFDDYDEVNYKVQGILCEILIALLILLGGLLLNCMFQLIIVTLIFNNLKLFSFGWHFGTFKKCLIFSTIYLISLSLISKYTVDYGLYTIFISIVLFIFTLQYVPNIPEEDKAKPDKFYITVYLIIFVFLIILDVIFIYIHIPYSSLISNSISFGIISVELFLTKSGYKVFRLIDGIKFIKIQKGEIE